MKTIFQLVPPQAPVRGKEFDNKSFVVRRSKSDKLELIEVEMEVGKVEEVKEVSESASKVPYY